MNKNLFSTLVIASLALSPICAVFAEDASSAAPVEATAPAAEPAAPAADMPASNGESKVMPENGKDEMKIMNDSSNGSPAPEAPAAE